jgi:hypothetical protein
MLKLSAISIPTMRAPIIPLLVSRGVRPSKPTDLSSPFPFGAERTVSMGIDARGRVLFVVYEWRGEPAREASLTLRRRYEESRKP